MTAERNRQSVDSDVAQVDSNSKRANRNRSNNTTNTNPTDSDEIEIRDEKVEPDEIESTNIPAAHAVTLARQAHKDHKCGLDAFLREGGQNALDAYFFRQSEGAVSSDLELVYSVDTDERTVEIWDNSGGMTAETLKNNFLALGNPGSEKLAGTSQRDTGGSQGKGFYVMLGHAETAYIETKTDQQGRWCSGSNYFAGDIGRPASPRSELDEPGTYLRFEQVTESALDDLSDTEQVLETLETVFAFALKHDCVNITYILDGETYEPQQYNFDAIADRGAVQPESGVDLDEFVVNKTDNKVVGQIENVVLIDQRELPAEFDPPWKGVALLKGGLYTPDETPYYSVWEYVSNKAEPVREGQLWGWADASSICPQAEKHGHVGFQGSNLWQDSGLLDHLLRASQNHYNSQTVEDQEQASRDIVNKINKYAEKYLDAEGDSGGDDTDGLPTDPDVFVSAGKNQHQLDSDIPISIDIETPRRSDIETVMLEMEIERIRDSDGELIETEDRARGVNTRSHISLTPGETVTVYNDNIATDSAGKYRLKARIWEQMDLRLSLIDETDNLSEVEQHKKRKPCVSSDGTYFMVGDIEFETTASSTTDGTSTDHTGSGSEIFSSISFTTESRDEKWWLTQVISQPDEGDLLQMNTAHPEFEAFVETFGVENKGDVQRYLGVRSALLRKAREQMVDEVTELLEENGSLTSEVEQRLPQIIREKVNATEDMTAGLARESDLLEMPENSDS